MPEILSGAIPFLGAITLPLLSGLLTLGFITGNQRFSVGFSLALGYALGMGILGQLMLLLGWNDFPINKYTVSFALLIYLSFISCLFLLRFYFFPAKAINLSRATADAWTLMRKFFFVMMMGYVVYQMCFVFWSAFYMPIDQADAFSVYAYKAKVLFYEHSLKRAGQLWPNYYPLQIPLSLTWSALNIGQWHEGWVQMIVSLNCLAFVVVIYNCMKFWTDRLTALLTTVFMLSSLFFVLHASIAYGDFAVMFYTMSSLLLISWGVYGRCASLIILGGIMSAFAASVKLEGIVYWILEGIVLCRFIFTREFFNPTFVLKALAGFILPFLIVEANFAFYKNHYGITELWNSQHFFVFSLQRFPEHIVGMIGALADNLFLSGNWNILWFFLIVMALANWRIKKTFAVKFFSFVLIMFFVSYFLAVALTRTAVYIANSQVLDSLSRLLLHFFPLCPVLIGLLTHNFLNNRRIQFATH